MKSFAAVMFASGAVALLAPYPNPAANSPAVYPTSAVPTKATYESAPYPYATEKKETSTTCTDEDVHYATETASYYKSKSEDKHESVFTYYSTVDKHASTETVSKVYVTKTFEHENQKPTDVITKTIVYTHGVNTITKTEVVVVPTYGANTETVIIVKPIATVYEAPKESTPVYEAPKQSAPVYEAPKQSDAINTETLQLTVTAPAAPVAATVCPAEATVTVTTKLYITVPEIAKPTGYAPLQNKTVIVTPIIYKPTGPASPVHPTPYAPANPSYASAANGTTSVVVKPTYSAPVQYTGAATKTAAGFGAFAMAVIALAL